ncbi:MAG: zinc ABC transporter substrate-binding protein [Bifidobacterium sp.]|uniref:metal ABC transporter solute-binding protein, Zn/Mn family n=1 Tax=Bifidobacterium sp. TaxID=41200 RepID=UPI0039E7AF80
MRQHMGLARRFLAIFLTMGTVVALSACSFASKGSATSSAQTSSSAGPIPVVATIRPWGSLAAELGGDQVSVTTIISDPNLAIKEYEPKTADITTIGKSRILMVNGAGYDDWAMKSVPKDATLVSASDAVGASEGDNPYLWFSKDVRNSVAAEMTEAFAKALPSKKSYFDARLKAWKKTETTLETLVRTVSSQADKKMGYAQERPIAYYLMADLGFVDDTPQKFAQTLSNNEEPTNAEINEFLSLLGESKHPSIFLQDSTQASTDIQKRLLKAARSNAVPVADVTEEMPSQETSLNGWITAITTNIAKATNLKTEIATDGGKADSKSSQSAQSSSDAQPTTDASSSSSNTGK